MAELLNRYSTLPSFLSTPVSGMLKSAVGSDEDCSHDGYQCYRDGECDSNVVCGYDGCPSDTSCSGDSWCPYDGWCSSDVPVPIYKTPSISSFSVSQTKVGEAKAECSFNITNYDSGATYEIEAQDSNGKWWTKAGGSVSGWGSATISFDNFGTYSVLLIVYNGSKSASATRSVTLTNIEKWSWNSSNGRATASQTYAAYRAVLNHGKVSNFSYLVWNDMCSKVYAVRTAVGGIGSWDTAYGSYSAAQMSASDRKLTARRFNNLKNQIGSQIGTGISDVSKGDTVKGSYFITIADRINNWIDRL